jgi:uncharacterized membrane protein YhaH (DUF805 family)
MNYYFAVLKKYAVFSGRARRKEYWFFTLFNMIVMFLLIAIDTATGSVIDPEEDLGILTTIYILGVIIPTIAVGVRRLHDTDRTGWWTLIYFVPLIGPLVFIYFTVLASDDGVNRFGESPLDEL